MKVNEKRMSYLFWTGWKKCERAEKIECIGFTEDEEYKLRQFVKNNSSLIWEIAREDGEIVADAT